MPHAELLRELLTELQRVGVDGEHMVAGLGNRTEEALRALRSLPDGAGAAAFLAELRNRAVAPVEQNDEEKSRGIA